MKDVVENYFGSLAPYYRENYFDKKTGKNFVFRKRLQLVQRLIEGTSGNLLDCACGTGEITSVVLKSGEFPHAVIIDISNEMLGYSKARLDTLPFNGVIEYKQTDIFQYKPDSVDDFNVILCLGLIAHIGNLTKLLCHLKTMLSPNGLILLQTSIADHPCVKIVRLLTSKRFSRRNGYAISYYCAHDIETSCRQTGLVIKDIKKFCFGFPIGDRIFALGNYRLERFMQGITPRIGSEAIFVLTQQY